MFPAIQALATGAILASLAAPAWAQPLGLHEAQRLAVARSEQLAANDAAASATRELAVVAGQLPDPVLKVGVENVPLSGPERFSLSGDFMTMTRVGVMQEITRRDKRRLRVERAEQDAARVAAERQMALAQIQRESALAWIDAAYAIAMLDLLKNQLAETRLQVEAAELAFRAGRGAQADIFGARAALAMLEDRLRQTERQGRNAVVLLARWIGEADARRPLTGSADWREAPGAARLLDRRHLGSHPHLLLQQVRVQAAEVEVRQAEANTRADWTVEMMYSRRGPAYSDMVSVGASLPLQLDRPKRQNRELAAKVGMLAAAEAALEEAVRAEEARVRNLLDEWATGKLRLERLTADLLPAARHRSEAALAAYRAGKGDLASALSARREEVDARMQLIALEMEVARLWAQLHYIVPDPALGAGKE